LVDSDRHVVYYGRYLDRCDVVSDKCVLRKNIEAIILVGQAASSLWLRMNHRANPDSAIPRSAGRCAMAQEQVQLLLGMQGRLARWNHIDYT
jgi:hypothetical protein